jgi:transcriptional regulator with XRE-family HTH domain
MNSATVEMDLKRNFASNLRKLREKLDLTQAELANRINDRFETDIKRTSIANYENESALPRMDILYYMGQYFGTTIDELITCKEEKIAQTIYKRAVRRRYVHKLKGNWTNGRAVYHYMEKTDDLKKMHEELDLCKIEIAEYLKIRVFNIEMNRNFLRKLKEEPAFRDNPKYVEELFSKTYLGTMLESGAAFERLAKSTLDENEYQVFEGMSKGMDSSVLQHALDLEEHEINNVFERAKEKITKSINTVNKL